MDRREAVKSVAFLIGGALSATTIATLFDSCNAPGKDSANLFTADQEKLITEVADIIIPTTKKSPGAKAANVGPFIVMMMKECYPDEVQKIFVKGLEDLENKTKKQFSKSFLEISVKEREEVLSAIREETLATLKVETDKIQQMQKSEADTKEVKPQKEIGGSNISITDKPKPSPQFFAVMRDLTLLGFFTSEIGATQAYEYVAVPGRYDGCTDLKPGQRVWA